MTFVVEHYHKDGHVFPLEVSASLIFSDGESLIQSFVRDITERKQAEEKLQLAASVFTHALEGIMITNADGTIIDVNDAFSEITGTVVKKPKGATPVSSVLIFRKKGFTSTCGAIWLIGATGAAKSGTGARMARCLPSCKPSALCAMSGAA
jgi:hypothetical protein